MEIIRRECVGIHNNVDGILNTSQKNFPIFPFYFDLNENSAKIFFIPKRYLEKNKRI